MESLTKEASPMSHQMTLLGSLSATSLLASADGVEPSASPSGQIAARSGLEAPLVSPTASLRSLMAERKAKAIAAICGRTSAPSSASVALQRSMESKLATRLAGVGGTKPQWILKPKVTPAQRLYCELTPLERRTKGGGSTGVPTPAARDGKDISRSTAFLSARLRHSPSLATRLLTQGAPWTAITAIYCLVMGYPLVWNATRPMATATPSSRRSRKPGSKP